jgi:hypothetical protein
VVTSGEGEGGVGVAGLVPPCAGGLGDGGAAASAPAGDGLGVAS